MQLRCTWANLGLARRGEGQRRNDSEVVGVEAVDKSCSGAEPAEGMLFCFVVVFYLLHDKLTTVNEMIASHSVF